MKKLWPYLLIFLTFIIFFRPVILKGFLPIPSDTIVGLYHPFRDMYAKDYPRGIPFKNFLITDPVRQLIPWKSLAIESEKHLQLPLWNPYNFSGSPLLANFQTGVFYPLNIIFFVLPFSHAWTFFIFLQQLLAGIFLYIFLRNLKVHPLASVLGSISFAFSGFTISWLEWGNIVSTILWVPLILLAKDKLIQKWSMQWAIVFFFAEVSAFFAGHLQLWFYAWWVTNAYLFLRVYQKTAHQNTKNFAIRYIRNYLPFLFVGIAMYAVTTIQSLPTLQFLLHSARNIDQNYLVSDGWFVPYQNLIQFIAPDFFGNPTTLNYWGVWNYAEFVGYIGILPLLGVFVAILGRRDKKTLFFGLTALLALLFALPTPLGHLPYMLKIPFLSSSQPTRLIGLVDLSLSILASLGIDMLLKRDAPKKYVYVALGIVGSFVIILWAVVLYASKVFPTLSLLNISIAKHNLVLPTVLFVITGALLLSALLLKKRISQKVYVCIVVVLILVTFVDQLRFAEKFTPFTSPSYLFPQEKVLEFLQNKSGNYRYMTTDSRIMAPNFSAMYKLQSVDGYDPLYLQNYAELIAASERDRADIHSPFGFNRIITPHNYNSKIMDLLGVKYVLSLEEIHIQKLEKVYQEGETRVYENKNVLPRAFFVKDVTLAVTKQEAITQIFASKNVGNTAVVTENISQKALTQGTVTIDSYQPNSVVLHTENNGDGFMVLTDIYYPSWRATIDGKETHIYPTDYALRGIFVPKGEHTIAFSAHLF